MVTNVVELTPARAPLRITQSTHPLDEKVLAGCDAALVVIDQEAADRGLSHLPWPRLWRRLRATAVADSGTPVLASRVPNQRHTLVAVGQLKRGASAFDRLSLGANLWRQVAAARPVHLVLAADTVADEVRPAILEALTAAVLAGDAAMPDFRSKPRPGPSVRTLRILRGRQPLDLARTLAVDEGNHLARWLTTLPPNRLDAPAYRRTLEALSQREGWSFEFLDEKRLEKLGAHAFLAVSRANAHRDAGIARLRLRPPGARRRPHLALVGKGVCFDTGGVNLKTHKSMFTMHEDMQGSAVAVGTLLALARLGTPYAVDCWLALTENEIGPRAYRPQDVVTAANGVTIQVVHSDAEGRMALADTLALAAREQPAMIIDYATLTGACVTALTERYSGVFTNRPDLLPALTAAGRESGERVWGFPLDEDFDADLESRIADVMQCAVEGRGDHILAARFLSRFAGNASPWVHLDLAASSHKGGLAHIGTDITGFGVRYTAWLLAMPEIAALLGNRAS
jgi:leucyl aminopeptidase